MTTEHREVFMEIGYFKKFDQKNRIHIPKILMDFCRIGENSEVYVSHVVGENFIRIYPKSSIEEEIKKKRKDDSE